MIEAGHMTKVEVITGIIKTIEVEETLETVGIQTNIIEVIRGSLKEETCHLTEDKVRM